MQIHLGITRQTCWLIRCLIMDENRQVHAKLLPHFKIWRTCVWKTIPLLSSRIRAFNHWKNTPFSLKWVRALIYALIGGGGGGGGRFINRYTKQMLKYHFQFFACFFLYVVIVIELTRFHGPYCLGTLYWYFRFCGNHEGHNNWPKPNHSKTPQIANCMHKSCDAPCIIPVVVG